MVLSSALLPRAITTAKTPQQQARFQRQYELQGAGYSSIGAASNDMGLAHAVGLVTVILSEDNQGLRTDDANGRIEQRDIIDVSCKYYKTLCQHNSRTRRIEGFSSAALPKPARC